MAQTPRGGLYMDPHLKDILGSVPSNYSETTAKSIEQGAGVEATSCCHTPPGFII